MKKLFTLALLLLLALVSCNAKKNTKETKYINGVWWWDKSLGDEYLEFAYENGINEIYYCDYQMNDDTYQFAKKCKSYNIDLFILLGEYSWINDSEPLYKLIDRYQEFQTNHNNILKGIHLDIEPHQSKDFKDNRLSLLTSLCKLAKDIRNDYKMIDISYDIPFWIDDVVNVDGISKKAYEHMLDYSDKCFIMSYRDTKEGIYNVALDEMEYARLNDRHLVLGVETYSTEGDHVSFMEEGKEYLNEVLESIRPELDKNVFGISIHQIKTWYSL